MQSLIAKSAKDMDLLCSRRCFRYFSSRKGVAAVTALFLVGYISGSLVRQDPFGKRSLLPKKTLKLNVEGIGDEAADDEEEKKAKQVENASSLNKTWDVYRACVKRPEPEVISKVITGELVLQERADKMTIEACLDSCVQSVFTYAALSRGHECYCTHVSSTSQFLSYVDSSFCDMPCTGDQYHNCGGKRVMSVYRTTVPVFQGGIIDYRGKSTICVKSHKSKLGHVDQFEGAILLIRNPYRALVAEVFRRQLILSKVSPDEAIQFFKSKEWQIFVNKEIDEWKVMQLRWIEMQRRFLPIFYEELEADTVRKLTEIVVFLNRTVEHERIVCATQDHPSSLATGTYLPSYMGKTREYLTKDPFTTGMHKKIDDSIKLVNDTLFKIHKKVLPAEYLKATDVF